MARSKPLLPTYSLGKVNRKNERKIPERKHFLKKANKDDMGNLKRRKCSAGLILEYRNKHLDKNEKIYSKCHKESITTTCTGV